MREGFCLFKKIADRDGCGTRDEVARANLLLHVRTCPQTRPGQQQPRPGGRDQARGWQAGPHTAAERTRGQLTLAPGACHWARPASHLCNPHPHSTSPRRRLGCRGGRPGLPLSRLCPARRPRSTPRRPCFLSVWPLGATSRRLLPPRLPLPRALSTLIFSLCPFGQGRQLLPATVGP